MKACPFCKRPVKFEWCLERWGYCARLTCPATPVVREAIQLIEGIPDPEAREKRRRELFAAIKKLADKHRE